MQIAKAARSTVDQIDIVDLYAQRDDGCSGSAGGPGGSQVSGAAAAPGAAAAGARGTGVAAAAVALVKFAEVVKCLAVTTVAGKDFPAADPTGGDPFVTLRLRPRPAAAGLTERNRPPGLLPAATGGGKLSLMAKLSQGAVHQTRARAGALRSPHPRFGDRFDFILYDENQVKCVCLACNVMCLPVFFVMFCLYLSVQVRYVRRHGMCLPILHSC
jgi:hypothetical protein